MEILKELIPIAIQVSLFLIVLSVGLDASADDASYLLKRPALLVRSYVAIAVIVPIFATLLTMSLPLSRTAKIGILLMAVSPLPPLVPGKEIRLGERKPYVYGLLVAVSLLSVVMVPLSIVILSAVFHEYVSISMHAVWGLVLKSVFLPLAIGMLIHRIAPQRAERAAPLTGKIANIVLIVSVLPVLFAIWPAVVHLIGNGTIVAIIAVVVVGILGGHMLGGPDPRDRAALAIASASRHPGIALLIGVANFQEPDIKAAILLFLIVELLTVLPYQAWHKRQYPLHQQAERDA